jgi:hypothetical protein
MPFSDSYYFANVTAELRFDRILSASTSTVFRHSDLEFYNGANLLNWRGAEDAFPNALDVEVPALVMRLQEPLLFLTPGPGNLVRAEEVEPASGAPVVLAGAYNVVPTPQYIYPTR